MTSTPNGLRPDLPDARAMSAKSVDLLQREAALSGSAVEQCSELRVEREVMIMDRSEFGGPKGSDRIETEAGTGFVQLVQTGQAWNIRERHFEVDLPVAGLPVWVLGVRDRQLPGERQVRTTVVPRPPAPLNDVPIGILARCDSLQRGLQELFERCPGSVDIGDGVRIETTPAKKPAEDLDAGLPGHRHAVQYPGGPA